MKYNFNFRKINNWSMIICCSLQLLLITITDVLKKYLIYQIKNDHVILKISQNKKSIYLGLSKKICYQMI